MTIRLRLALWYTGLLGVTLIVFSLLLYTMMQRHLTTEADASIADRARHIAGTIRLDPRHPPAASGLILPPIDVFESAGVYVQVVDKHGEPLARSDNLGAQNLPEDAAALAAAREGRPSYYTARVGAERVRVYASPLVVEQQGAGIILVGQSSGEAERAMERLQFGLLSAGSLSLLLAAGIGWVLAARALRPVATMIQTARAIALSRGFSRRLPASRSHDELGQLGRTFNEMLGSLEEAYAAQQRFVADASHELRTPLTTVRGNLELLEQRGEDLPPRERQELVAAAHGEAARMARLVEALLALARADAGQQLTMTRVELDRVVLDVYQQGRALGRDVKLTMAEIDQVAVRADADRLKQLLLILVDNAVKHTPAGGEVSLALRKASGEAEFAVVDTGFGISQEDLPHIFERFYRADTARARDHAGSGLGLAIALWIAGQHGGSIDVTSIPGQGSTFTVHLPLSS